MNKQTDLFDYLAWRGDITFDKDSFNKIDGMIMARLSYAPFEYVLTPAREKSSIKSICNGLLRKKKAHTNLLSNKDLDLFDALAHSSRFAKMRIGHYTNIYDEEEQTQFSAITVQINKSLHIVVFRGTDDTIIGWKEDVNMGFISPIASQRYALEYLEKIAELTSGQLILAGHSKGGNLAAYAAAFANDDIQHRISDVYNYDGPGFVDQVLETEGYKKVCEKIHTYVPQGSIVGMLLGHNEEYQVIHSYETNMPMQHCMYSWAVMGKDFIEEENTTSQSKYFDNTIKNWLATMDNSQREKFVESAYSIIKNMDAKTITDVRNNWAQNVKIMYNSMKNIDDDTKNTLNEGIRLFMKSMKDSIGGKT